MIKINLLPGYIIERRRVKALAILLGFLLIAEVVLLLAYLWAPAPFSMTQRLKNEETQRDEAFARQTRVQEMEAEIQQVKAIYQAKESWVKWVEDADAKPAQWVAYYKTLNDYFPADVVVYGLPLPSGNTLNLQGSTSGMMAAARWYLNMLRCRLVSPDPNAVSFSPGQVAAGAANPKMQMPVSISITLKPEALDMMMSVATPADVGGGGRVGGAGRGGRMGGGRGGGGMRGGGGRGGGGRGGGGRGGGGRGGGGRGGGGRGGGPRGGR
jgi:Tfp pilus assembly protein PilN